MNLGSSPSLSTMSKQKVKLSEKSASKTEDGLNLQQEAFCQLYINADRELFGNGAQCYLEVYGAEYSIVHKKPMSYQTAMASASRLLSNVKVITRVNDLLQTGGFNNENVDKQHLFLINQHADLKTKMSAIREYNELRNRITKKVEITGLNGAPLFSDEHRAKSNEALKGLLS